MDFTQALIELHREESKKLLAAERQWLKCPIPQIEKEMEFHRGVLDGIKRARDLWEESRAATGSLF